MARTQAVFYRDSNGIEPIDAFIEALGDKQAAKIDAFVDEHLNGRDADETPPEFRSVHRSPANCTSCESGSPERGTGSATGVPAT